MIRTLMHSLSSCLLACFSIAGALIVIAPAYGASITFSPNVEFSGATAPSGSAPWLQATFEDVGVDTVKLTMSDLTLAGNPNPEFVIVWLFNLDPDLTPTDLVFSALSVDSSKVNLALSDFTTGEDAFQADGDGDFDIMVAFDVSNPMKSKDRFTAGDVVSVEITLAGLTANSFNFFSFMNGGGQGSFLSAAQVGGIGPNDESGWVGAVPEPTSGMLLLVGCFAGGLFAGRRKRR